MHLEQINPAVAMAVGVGKGAELNSQAYRLQCAGDVRGAERTYLEAIRVREQSLGADHHLTAISYNSIGELYMQMGKLDKAESYFNKALRIRVVKGLPVDLAVTRDNLGRLYEMKGDLKASANIRREGGPDNVACSNYGCIKFSNSLSDLSQCSGCKATLYCSEPCQSADWKRHKKYCRPDSQPASPTKVPNKA